MAVFSYLCNEITETRRAIVTIMCASRGIICLFGHVTYYIYVYIERERKREREG